MPVKRTTLTCRGPLAPRPSSCPKRPAKDCPYLLCTTCCIARGGWGFCGCQVDRHRTYINHAHYFEPNFSFPSPTPHRPYYLPVVSPLSGDFTRPSGFAYMDCIAEGWDSEVGQARLEAEATARFLNEGITVYIFIWAKEKTEPATYMRVIRQGGVWSLRGDSALLHQLETFPSNDFKLFDITEKKWTTTSWTTEVPITAIGSCLYIKSSSIVHTPHMITLLDRMFNPVSIPS